MRKSTVLRFAVLIGCVVPYSLALMANARADGLGVAPTTLLFNEALRGKQYVQDVAILHDFPQQRTYRMEAIGDIAQWVEFAETAEGEPVQQIDVEPRTRALFVVRVNIPPETPNGQHAGMIRVVSIGATPAGEGSGAGINLGLEVPMAVQVTGTQILTGGLADISTREVEVGMPLRIEARVDNTGNVGFIPQLHVEIVNSEGAVAGETNGPEQVIPAGKTETIIVEWDTAGQKPGDFVATVSGKADTLDLGTKEFAFRLVPFGSLTRAGELEALEMVEEARPGGLAKFAATFRNTGQIDATSRFVGELYRDGELIAQVTSEPLYIKVEGVERLEAIAEIPAAGTYVLRGKVNFESNETEARELTFIVEAPDGGSNQAIWLAGGGGGLLALVAIAGIVLGRRKLRAGVNPERG